MRLRRAVLAGLSLVVLACAALPAAAVQLLRDPDIEYALRQVATPILRAAGLSPERVRILVVNDSKLNAFVIDPSAIFINYGLILKLERPDMLQGVIAHEAAHIVNGHITRRMVNMRNARTIAGLGMALAAVAAVGGQGEAATGIALGTSSSAQRLFLQHTRAEEASADQSGVRYMRAAKVSPKGLLDVHRIFEGQELLSDSLRDPYAQSHPLSRDRARAMEAFVTAYGDDSVADPTTEYWYARARGKLSAFTRSPKWTFARADKEPAKDITLMRQAIAYHRNSNAPRAMEAMNAAIALRPDDPFYYDLKGQILLESRQMQSAVAAYKQAVTLAPTDSLILSGYGRALLAVNQYKDALTVLEKARARDFRDTNLLRDLAVAYARDGQNGMASLVTAERYALQGRLDDAEIHANRALGLLPVGSGPWQRAQDVVSAAKLN
jgi:predicted Zn-dependent protease